MPQPPLRPSTSTSSFLIVSRAADPSSAAPGPRLPSSPTAGPPAPPPLARAWVNILPALALLDLAVTLALCAFLWESDVLPVLGWCVVRTAVVGRVGWGVRAGTTGAGPGWISGTSTLTVLLVFWQLNLLFQTRARHSAHAPHDLGLAAAAVAASASLPAPPSLIWTSETLSMALLGAKRRGLRAHLALLAFTGLIALVEETASIMISARLPPGHGRRPFALRRPRQAATFLPFSISSTRLPSSDDGDSVDALDDEALDGSDDDEAEDDLSESEIVDIPPSFPSSTSHAGSPRPDKLARSLSRSWSRRQVHADGDWAPGAGGGASRSRPARAGDADDGYGTFEDGRH